METILMFLAKNYLWFIGGTVFTFFALIGYIVDEKERKNGISLIDRPKEEERDLHNLAINAGNKSLNKVVSDNVKNTSNSINSSIPQNSNIQPPF